MPRSSRQNALSKSPEQLIGELERAQRKQLDAAGIHLTAAAAALSEDVEAQLTDLGETLRLRDRAIAASANGILITEANGTNHPIIYVNPAFERMTGYTLAEVQGRDCRFLQGADRNQPALASIRQAIAAEREVHAELRNYRKDGTMFWNELYISPVRDECGHVTHFIGVQNDVTARKQAENDLVGRTAELEQAYAELKALDSLRGNFFGLVSHELRTPLSSIVGFAEFLEDGFGGTLSDEQSRYVTGIQASARRLEGLVNDLLDFARLEAGQFRLTLSDGDLCETCREVFDGFAPQAFQKGVTLDLALPDGPIAMLADHPRLSQVLTNLVGNAIKFTPEGGHIQLAVRRGTDSVQITVADTGRGIAPEHIARLFDKFYQVESTTTRAYGGAGLGLAIAKALVEAHHGEIGVQSTPQVGTTFWLNLPLCRKTT